MFIGKEKDEMFVWIFKFAARKKLGMLLLCFVSIAVVLWILYVGKGLFFVSLKSINYSSYTFDFRVLNQLNFCGNYSIPFEIVST